MDPAEKKKFLGSLLVPALLLAVMWGIKLAEIIFKADFSQYGIYPQHLPGLVGIILSPFLHGSVAHLSANSVPFFVLTAGLIYFYGKPWLQIFIFSWLMTGFWVWVFAKDTGIHIGSSGVVYALAAFHFTGGLIRREPRMLAFALLVVFLYGGLVWGVFPELFPDKNISWESHLLGLAAGVILAFFYKNEGPQAVKYEWDEEDEDGIDGIDGIDGTDGTGGTENTKIAGSRKDIPGGQQPGDEKAKPGKSPGDDNRSPVKIVYHLRKREYPAEGDEYEM